MLKRRKSVLEREELEAREKLIAYKFKMMNSDQKKAALKERTIRK